MYDFVSVTNKTQEHLRAAFKETDQQPLSYDLFPITIYLMDYLDYNQRQRCRLTTTGEVMRAIKYMNDKDLF